MYIYVSPVIKCQPMLPGDLNLRSAFKSQLFHNWKYLFSPKQEFFGKLLPCSMRYDAEWSKGEGKV